MKKHLVIAPCTWSRILVKSQFLPDAATAAFIQDTAHYKNTIHFDKEGNLISELSNTVPTFMEFFESFATIAGDYDFQTIYSVASYATVDELACKLACQTPDKLLVSESEIPCVNSKNASLDQFLTKAGPIGVFSNHTKELKVGDDARSIFNFIHHLLSRHRHSSVLIADPYIMRNGSEGIFKELVASINASNLVVYMKNDLGGETYRKGAKKILDTNFSNRTGCTSVIREFNPTRDHDRFIKTPEFSILTGRGFDAFDKNYRVTRDTYITFCPSQDRK